MCHCNLWAFLANPHLRPSYGRGDSISFPDHHGINTNESPSSGHSFQLNSIRVIRLSTLVTITFWMMKNDAALRLFLDDCLHCSPVLFASAAVAVDATASVGNLTVLFVNLPNPDSLVLIKWNSTSAPS